MKRSLCLCAATMILWAGTAQSQEMKLDVGAGISTLGAELRLSYPINSRVSVRGIYAGGLSGDTSDNVDGVDYDVSGKWGGLAALVDYRPYETGLRLTGGLFKSNSEISVGTTITQPTIIGDTEYNSGSIDANVTFDRTVAPMLSLGYDLQLASGWTFSTDLGAILTNGFKVSATATGPISQSDLNAEMGTLSDDLNQLKAVPYFAFGVSYQF